MVNNKILIVEDDEVISNLIKWRLVEMGYRICGQAATGAEAISLTNETNPDAILMDLSLKGDMDGIETSKTIKKHFNIPIIILTAHSEEKILEKITPIKPADYILKPFTDDELRVALHLALSE
jgi:two-component system, response regulator PdtaR